MEIKSCLFWAGCWVVAILPVVPAIAAGQTFSGKVHNIRDGDTIEVLRPTGQIITVHLWGIDAPEIGQPYGEAALRGAQRVAAGNRVRVVERDDDRAGRPLAEVRLDGGTLNEWLVRKGLAWHCAAQARTAFTLNRSEQSARDAERGLWSQAQPVPPWRWRESRGDRPGPPEQSC